MSRTCFRAFALVAALGLAACSAPPESREATASSAASIVNGTRASDYPEALIVNILMSGQTYAVCSGSLIAPQIVLTAGHCVAPFNEWGILAPYNGGQKGHSTKALTYDYKANMQSIDPNSHDVSLLVLDAPMKVSAAQCPVLAQQPLKANGQVVNIGRIDSGQLSYSDLFVSAPLAVQDASSMGYPYDYSAQLVVQEGDSGGPDEVPGSSPHEIVAVNSWSANDGSAEGLARVDLVYKWIQQQIQANGGGCDATAQDAGSASSPDGSTGSGGSSGGSSSSSGGDGDGGNGANWSPTSSKGGCGVSGVTPGRSHVLSLAGLAVLSFAARRRRRPLLGPRSWSLHGTRR